MDDKQVVRWLSGWMVSWAVLALVVVLLLWLVGCDAGSPKGSMPVATATLPPLPTLDAAVIAQGRQVYEQHCAACHGAKAEGAPGWEKLDARGNLPPPPHDDSGHTWRHGDGELYRIIQDGWRDRFNKTPELTMPPFKDKLSDAEIRAVVTYFKSLWTEEHRLWQWERTLEEVKPRR